MADDPARAYAAVWRQAAADAHVLLDGIPEDVANRKPAPDAWSAAECLDHLVRIGAGYLDPLGAAVAQLPARTGPPTRHGFIGKRFVSAVRPTSPRKLQTGGAMRPPRATAQTSALDAAATCARFVSQAEAYAALCDASAGRDLAAVRVRSPFLPLVRLPAGTFLDALGQHALRHLGQARRAIGSVRPPTTGPA